MFTSLSTFYKQLIEFWEPTFIGICGESSSILNQSLWHTKYIPKSGITLYHTTLSEIKVLIYSRIF